MRIIASGAANVLVALAGSLVFGAGAGQAMAARAPRQGPAELRTINTIGLRSSATPGSGLIFALNSGLVLTVPRRPAPGVPVVAEYADSKQTVRGKYLEQWKRGRLGRIRLVSHPGLCLNVPGTSYVSHIGLNLAPCNGSQRERFTVTSPSAHTPVYFIHLAGRQSLCLDIPGLDPGQPWNSAGQSVMTAPCSPNAGEAWSTEDLDPYGAGGPPASVLRAKTTAASTGTPVRAGSVVRYQPFTNDLNQYWELSAASDGDRIAWAFSPVANTSLCLTATSPAASGSHLTLQPCSQAPDQQFLTIIRSSARRAWGPWGFWIATADARYCVDETPQGGSTGQLSARPCAAASPTPWSTWLQLGGWAQTIGFWYSQVGNVASPVSLTAPTSVSGGPVSLTASGAASAYQTWTEITPGTTDSGNPDGSISLRPFSNLNLCLTAPGPGYPVNVPLQALPCNGSASQEFMVIYAGSALGGGAKLVPFANGSLCVSAVGTAGGTAPGLQSCADSTDQAWGGISFPDTGPIRIAPYSNAFAPVGAANVSASSGQAALETLALGHADQVWVKVSVAGGYVLHWGLNTAWCLDAPQYVAGQQLTIQACDGSQNQVFTISNDRSYPEMFAPAGDQALCLAAAPAPSQPVTLQSCDSSQAGQIWWYYPVD